MAAIVQTGGCLLYHFKVLFLSISYRLLAAASGAPDHVCDLGLQCSISPRGGTSKLLHAHRCFQVGCLVLGRGPLTTSLLLDFLLA